MGLVFVILRFVTFRNRRKFWRADEDVGVGDDGEQRCADDDGVEVEQILELQVGPLGRDDVHVAVPVTVATSSDLKESKIFLHRCN